MSFTIEVKEGEVSPEVKYNKMTKYEYVMLIAERVNQLNAGQLPLVECEGIFNNHEIAKKELHQRVLPFVIRRNDKGDVKILKLNNTVISSY